MKRRSKTLKHWLTTSLQRTKSSANWKERNIVVGGKKPQVAKVGNATPAMRDALVDLRRAKETYGYDAFGAEGEVMAGLETSLSEQAEPAERRKRERRVAADAVSEDRRIREGNLTDDEIATEYKKRISTIEENRSGITSRPRFEAAAQRNQSRCTSSWLMST